MGEQLPCERKPELNAGGRLICHGGEEGLYLHHWPSSSEKKEVRYVANSHSYKLPAIFLIQTYHSKYTGKQSTVLA